MMRTVKCAICGKEFETDKPHVKYCSLECRAEGQSRLQSAWHKRHLDYYKNHYGQHRHEIG